MPSHCDEKPGPCSNSFQISTISSPNLCIFLFFVSELSIMYNSLSIFAEDRRRLGIRKANLSALLFVLHSPCTIFASK